MTQRKPFDYQSFITRFRQRCAARGVDPLNGATTFDVVTLKADTNRAQTAATVTDWWQDAELWCEAAPYRDVVEEDALERVRREAFASAIPPKPARPPRQATEPFQPDDCPYCGADARFQHFWRFNTDGRQYMCSKCDRLYTPERGKTGFADELRERAFAMHREGKTNEEIVDALHVGRDTVRRWLKAFGVVRGARAPYPPEVRRRAFELHAEGMIVEHIARTLNVHERTIATWIRSGIVAPKRTMHSQEVRQRARDLRKTGKSAAFIAEALGVPYNTIRNWLLDKDNASD